VTLGRQKAEAHQASRVKVFEAARELLEVCRATFAAALRFDDERRRHCKAFPGLQSETDCREAHALIEEPDSLPICVREVLNAGEYVLEGSDNIDTLQFPHGQRNLNIVIPSVRRHSKRR
jgi:hypothetical protein